MKKIKRIRGWTVVPREVMEKVARVTKGACRAALEDADARIAKGENPVFLMRRFADHGKYIVTDAANIDSAITAFNKGSRP